MSRLESLADCLEPLAETLLDRAAERDLSRESKWLDTRQCANRLGINVITLIRWRKMSPPRGPRAYVAHDSRLVRYKTAEVDRWQEGSLPEPSSITADTDNVQTEEK